MYSNKLPTHKFIICTSNLIKTSVIDFHSYNRANWCQKADGGELMSQPLKLVYA